MKLHNDCNKNYGLNRMIVLPPKNYQFVYPILINYRAAQFFVEKVTEGGINFIDPLGEA
jgi:hypothetical protein